MPSSPTQKFSIFSLLFEQPQQNILAPPRLGMLVDELSIFVYDTEVFLQQIIDNANEGTGIDPLAWAGGLIDARDSGNECYGAYQVGFIAANNRQEFKGVGKLLYILLSKYFDAPITSDRDHSSSKADRAAWDKLASSGTLKKVQDLDNYFEKNSNRTYVDISPDRKFKELPSPKTSLEIDDCPLPQYGGEADLAKAVEYTGTPYIWKYKGPVNAESFHQRHQQVMNRLEQLGISTTFAEESLKNGASILWNSTYKGVDG